MALHPLAGKPAPAEMLIDPRALERAYHEKQPDPDDRNQQVAFGTSGHRGSPLHATFNEAHVLAITQAICEYRAQQGIDGPLLMGKDTHAVSRPAEQSALEVLAANGVQVRIQQDDGATPTPAISHGILAHNRGRQSGLADGIVITPSHNPPPDGGFKYNPPNGGPADTDVTRWIENRANALLREGLRGVRRVPLEAARRAASTQETDFVAPYVEDLAAVVDLDAVRAAGLRIGVDALGGAAGAYWQPIADRYGLDVTIMNAVSDPTFRFVSVDHDGQIRMDCSSSHAMASLVALKNRFDIAFGNDADADRHGIVTASAGLMNSNHFLVAAIHYLLTHRPDWSGTAAVGKTLVSSALIDRVVGGLDRKLFEVPVGFKWFAPGLLDGSLCFGGEESAGASFVRRDGRVWTTDKDGLILGLLAAEITARTGKDPAQNYRDIAARYGEPRFVRIDAPATPEQKRKLAALAPESVTATELAGEAITARVTRAAGNGAGIGGLKVETAGGWFAARPSGTENIYKLYAESFRDEAHLARIVEEAQQLVSRVLAASG